MYYQVEGRGVSIHLEDHNKFEELPSKIEVVSGGWYGNKGRWAPLERYTGTIICEDVDEMKSISEQGKDFSFKVRKPFFLSRVTSIPHPVNQFIHLQMLHPLL